MLRVVKNSLGSTCRPATTAPRPENALLPSNSVKKAFHCSPVLGVFYFLEWNLSSVITGYAVDPCPEMQ